MSSEQKSEQKSENVQTNPTNTKKQPIDDEIMTMKMKQLKAYIKTNNPNSPYLPLMSEQITEKDHVRFIALDSVPSGWTKPRIQNLAINCRRYFIEEKIKKYMGDKYDKKQDAKFSKYIQPKPQQETEIDLIIDEIIQIIHKNDKNHKNAQKPTKNDVKNDYIPTIDADLPDEDEKNQRTLARTDNNNNNDMSSVSTHSSMPSLMSDDESDDADDLDDSDESEDYPEDISETKENILDTSSNDEEQKKTNKTNKIKNKKIKKKKDDFLTGFGAGFLDKKNQKKKKNKNKNKSKPKPQKTPKIPPKVPPKQKTKREQLKLMGYVDATIDKISLKIGESASISEFVDEIERLKQREKAEKSQKMRMEAKAIQEDRKKVGFRLSPENIDAWKSSDGNLFLCIGARKEKARLSDYEYLKCNVSLKLKLKKKGKKLYSYAATLIDLREKAPQLRDIERQKLKIGFENVLSFEWNADVYIIDVQRDYERKLSLDEAFKEYKQMQILRKEDKKVAKLVTAGFDDEDARKALEMSMRNDEKIEGKNKKKVSEKKKILVIHKNNDDENDEKNEKKNEKQKTSKNNDDKNNTEKVVKYIEKVENKKKVTENQKISPKNNDNDENMKKKVTPPQKIPPKHKNNEIKEEKSESAKQKTENKNQKKVAQKQKISPPNDINPNENNKKNKEKSTEHIDEIYDKNYKTKIFIQNNHEIKEEKSPAKNDEISCELMNLCLFNQRDLLSVIDDPEIDYSVQDVYVRVHWNSRYKLHKIEKTMDYSQAYSFIDVKTTKGLQISEGKTIKNIKLRKISNDPVTLPELNTWKSRMTRDNIPLPDIPTLTDISEKIKIIQTAASQKASNTHKTPNKTTQKSPSRPGLLSHSFKPQSQSHNSHSYKYQGGVQLHQLNAQMLNVHDALSQQTQIQHLLQRYITAIQAGCITWWCIPTAPGDTQFVAFLLRSTKAYKPVLADAVQLATEIASQRGYDLDYVEIRERVIESEKSFKAKGFLFDCKDKKCATSVKNQLQHFFPSRVKKAKHCTNFCRLVLAEFAAEYMRVQLLPGDERPKVDKSFRNKPQGPKYGYKNGEASIEHMVLNMDEREIYGESDHTISNVGSVCSSVGMASVCSSEKSHNSYKSNLSSGRSEKSHNSYKSDKMTYDDVTHMTYVQQPGCGYAEVVEKIKKKKKIKKVEVVEVVDGDDGTLKEREGDYKEGDRVLIHGNNEVYDVIVVFHDRLMIQNDFGSRYLPQAEYHMLSRVE